MSHGQELSLRPCLVPGPGPADLPTSATSLPMCFAPVSFRQVLGQPGLSTRGRVAVDAVWDAVSTPPTAQFEVALRPPSAPPGGTDPASLSSLRDGAGL